MVASTRCLEDRQVILYIAMNISTLLREHLRDSPCRTYNSDMKFKPSEKVSYYPDVTVSCDSKDTQAVKHELYYPRLIVEVPLIPTN